MGGIIGKSSAAVALGLLYGSTFIGRGYGLRAGAIVLLVSFYASPFYTRAYFLLPENWLLAIGDSRLLVKYTKRVGRRRTQNGDEKLDNCLRSSPAVAIPAAQAAVPPLKPLGNRRSTQFHLESAQQLNQRNHSSMDLQYPCCQEPDILQAHRLLHPSLPQFPHGLENGLIPGEWDDSLDCEDVRSPGNLYTQRRSNRESQKSIPILSKKSATVDFSILGSVCTNFLGKGSCQVKSYKVELTRLGRRVAELGSPEHQMYANVSSKTGRISIWTELKRSTMSTMTPEL